MNFRQLFLTATFVAAAAGGLLTPVQEAQAATPAPVLAITPAPGARTYHASHDMSPTAAAGILLAAGTAALVLMPRNKR